MPKTCGPSAGGDLATPGDAVLAAQQAVRQVMEYMQQQMVRDPAVWGALAACIGLVNICNFLVVDIFGYQWLKLLKEYNFVVTIFGLSIVFSIHI